MKVELIGVKVEGSCNYCEKGHLKSDGMGLDFPYKKVIKVTGNTINTRFCKECFERLVNTTLLDWL